MAQNSGRTKRSEKGLLTPDNCVVAIIDLQPQMLFGVANFDRQTIINNNVALLKAARVFDVPVVLSTVETKSFFDIYATDSGVSVSAAQEGGMKHVWQANIADVHAVSSNEATRFIWFDAAADKSG